MGSCVWGFRNKKKRAVKGEPTRQLVDPMMGTRYWELENWEAAVAGMRGPKSSPFKDGLGRRRRWSGTLQREKNGVYTIRLMVNGRRIAKSTRTKDIRIATKILDEFAAPFVHKDRVMSLKMLEAQVADIDQREALEEEYRPTMPLRYSWWYYIDSARRKEVSEDTLKQKRQIWENFVRWIALVYEENMEVKNVTREIAETYLLFMKKSIAPSTWNGRLCFLREIYRVLMPKAKAKINPFSEIPFLPEDTHRRRGLKIEEIKRLLQAAKEAGEQWHTLILFGIYTGLRLGDCSKLVWNQIDFERGIIQLIPSKKRKGKSGRPATIPIHPHLSRLLTALKAKADAKPPPSVTVQRKRPKPSYVLEEMARLYNRAGHRLTSSIAKIFAAAGIETSVELEGRKGRTADATFHSLRHTFVSLAANAGVPIHVIQSIVGHETAAMTWHYYHVDEEAMRKAICAIPSFDDNEKGDGNESGN